MATPRTSHERIDDDSAAVRRAPFSDNPRVGARGQRTQQRILDAALRAFGEAGYHACSIDRIAKLARCSRVSFYQYFASKEEVFQHLAGQVARQLMASTEALSPLTPDGQGWSAVRAWVARYAEIYTRYEPVFNAYETDEVLAAIAARTGDQIIGRLRAKLVTTTLPPRQLDPVIRLLLQTLNHALGVAAILRSAVPAAYPSERFEVAATDVLHRTLFGLRADVNVHDAAGPPSPPVEFNPAMLEWIRQDDADLERDDSASRALNALLASGHDVFVSRGYHNTRVDDLVAAAGVSHGAFYRYFRNKDELARILTARALRATGMTLMEIPDVLTGDSSAVKGALRRWLRRFHSVQAPEAGMMRVWIDAALQDPALRSDLAPPLDWGRRRMSRYLLPRGFGDIDMEAVVMVALLGVIGAQERSAGEIDAASHFIERGLLGR
jgi:AcrR family transcriptional regulator